MSQNACRMHIFTQNCLNPDLCSSSRDWSGIIIGKRMYHPHVRCIGTKPPKYLCHRTGKSCTGCTLWVRIFFQHFGSEITHIPRDFDFCSDFDALRGQCRGLRLFWGIEAKQHHTLRLNVVNVTFRTFYTKPKFTCGHFLKLFPALLCHTTAALLAYLHSIGMVVSCIYK